MYGGIFSNRVRRADSDLSGCQLCVHLAGCCHRWQGSAGSHHAISRSRLIQHSSAHAQPSKSEQKSWDETPTTTTRLFNLSYCHMQLFSKCLTEHF